jgi:hypothetical protein
MSEAQERIKRLAALIDAEGKPLIRTSDGRDLRQPHILLKEPLVVCRGYTQIFASNLLPVGATEVAFLRYMEGDYVWIEEGKECGVCHGTGWLPVDEPTAVLVCMEYIHAHEWSLYLRHYILAIRYGNFMTTATIHDHNVGGALLEVVERIAGSMIGEDDGTLRQ